MCQNPRVSLHIFCSLNAAAELLCLFSQCNNAHVEAPSSEERCGCAVEATVCLGPRCCLSELCTGVARGPLLPLHQVPHLQWQLRRRVLGSQVLLHDVLGCDLVDFIITTFYICALKGHMSNSALFLRLALQAFIWLCSGSVPSRSLSCHVHRLVSKRLSALVGLADGHRNDGIKQQPRPWPFS